MESFIRRVYALGDSNLKDDFLRRGQPGISDHSRNAAGVTPIRPAPEDGSYFQNLAEIRKTTQAVNAAKLDKPVDRDEWSISPYEVNAYNILDLTIIEFPAAILQAPIYDPNASYETKLGGVGYVIGHEITHAFDNNGAKFDETGNAADWWTAADYAAFNSLCQAVVDYYDGQECVPGIICDGELTLSENIADLGALACVTQIASGLENPDYGALYRNAAAVWASIGIREYQLYLARTDIHAHNKLRVNLVLQSCVEFYEAFGITEGNGM